MRKTMLCLAVAMVMAVTMQAAKALRKPTVITQSDGTTLTVIGHGDEDFHYYTTMDGVLLYHEGYDYFVASIDDDGNLVCTTQLAHEASGRSAAEVELVKIQDKAKFFAAANAQANKAKATRAASVANDNTLFPHAGSPKVLVVLAEFSDVKFTVNEPKKAFDQYLNAEYGQIENLGNKNQRNYGSVKQYFKDMSFGEFVPQFDVYGPVTLGQPLSHYGAGDNDHMGRFIPDVCKAVDSEIYFSDYDRNGDGKVDLVYVIYAGYSQSWSGNSSDCIWPKSGTISGGTYDGVAVYRYGVNNELNYNPEKKEQIINGIGLFCHEFSHCLGMPDLYVTTGGATEMADNQEMEYWSIMDSGTYLADGYYPTAYTAWEREFFGWLDIETLENPTYVELEPIDSGGKAYRIMNDNDDSGNEYYILENIQNKDWNQKQFGHGMLALHVDYDAHAFSLKGNCVNNTLGYPRMTVLAADGLLLNQFKASSESQLKAEAAGDPFPGTGEVHELTDETTVYPIIYTGDKLNKPIYDIQEDTGTGIVTFKFLDRNATSIKETVTEKVHDDRIYTLDGRFVGVTTEGLEKGIYIINNKKVVIR